MMDSTATLLTKIEGFLASSGESATAFGWRAINDPQFVHDLRKGRQVRSATASRIEAYMLAATETRQ